MKITAKQLRHIIKEEISRVSEATPVRGGGPSSPGVAKMLQALNLQQVVSDIDNEYAPNFGVDNTDKKVFKAGDVVVDAEYDGGRFVVRVTDAGLEIMSKPAGGRARKAVLKDASPASAEKLADFANSAFGTSGGLEIFDMIRGGDMLRGFTDEYELKLTIDNTAKTTMKSGEVIARMEYEQLPPGFKGKKPFLELVHRLDGLEVRTSNPEMNLKYPSASWGVEDELHNHIAEFWRV
jgi:hypothetical protein